MEPFPSNESQTQGCPWVGLGTHPGRGVCVCVCVGALCSDFHLEIVCAFMLAQCKEEAEKGEPFQGAFQCNL